MFGRMRLAALAAILSLGGAAALGAQSADSSNARPRRPFPDGEMRGPGRGMRGPGGDGFAAMRDGMRDGMRGGMRGPLMRGITLSDAQEKALRAVHVKQITDMKPLQLDLVSARADARIAQLNGDQKALDAANARLDAAREKVRKLADERSPVSDLRAILTPEQQKILDRNIGEGARNRAAGPGGRRDPRGAGRGFGPGRDGRPRGPRDFAPRRMDERDDARTPER